jgi:hypothetical protein
MTTRARKRIDLTVVTFDSRSDFEATRTRFDERVPLLDPSVTLSLVNSQAAWSEVEAAITQTLGPTGFLAVSRVDQGALMSLRGTALHATQYLVGNPLIATEVIGSVRDGSLCPVSSNYLRGPKWRARLLHASVQSLHLLGRSRGSCHRRAAGRQDRGHGGRGMRSGLSALGPYSRPAGHGPGRPLRSVLVGRDQRGSHAACG